MHLEFPDLEIPARRYGVGRVCRCVLVAFVGSDLRSDPRAEAGPVSEVLPGQLGDLIGELGSARPVSRAQLEPRTVEAHRLDHLLVPAIRCAPQRVRECLARLIEAVEVHKPECPHDARRRRARRRVSCLLERERVGQRILRGLASSEKVDQEQERRRVRVGQLIPGVLRVLHRGGRLLAGAVEPAGDELDVTQQMPDGRRQGRRAFCFVERLGAELTATADRLRPTEAEQRPSTPGTCGQHVYQRFEERTCRACSPASLWCSAAVMRRSARSSTQSGGVSSAANLASSAAAAGAPRREASLAA